MVDRVLTEAAKRGDPCVDLPALAKSAARIAARPLLEAVLNETDWDLHESARRLGIGPRTVAMKMRECGLRRRR